ncbi:MAG: hypothetical protein WAK55_04350, partial [Xanthobacteraceae bacterium]
FYVNDSFRLFEETILVHLANIRSWPSATAFRRAAYRLFTGPPFWGRSVVLRPPLSNSSSTFWKAIRFNSGSLTP